MFLSINCKLSRGWVIRLVDVILGCGARDCFCFNLGLVEFFSKLDTPGGKKNCYMSHNYHLLYMYYEENSRYKVFKLLSLKSYLA